jgi:hypothetical protein
LVRWSDNFSSGWSRTCTGHHPDEEVGVSGDARVEERDLEWPRAEFCQKSLYTSQRPAIPMLTNFVKTVTTANVSRVRGYTVRVQK